MSTLPVTRVVLYKHGVGYFEREGPVEGNAVLGLTFKQSEVSDVLKSLTVLDLNGGHVASVSYDSTKPLEQLLAEVSLSIPDEGSLVGLLPQIKGARVAVQPGDGGRAEGVLLGVDTSERRSADGVVKIVLLALLTDAGEVRSFDLHQLDKLEILDAALRRDLDFYLRTQLSAKKKDARTFSFFAQGEGKRAIRLSYTLEAPVWKATYRILLNETSASSPRGANAPGSPEPPPITGEPGALAPGGTAKEAEPPLIQGWAVVDNTQDEDWENVQLSLVAGLPVSFVHDLYTPRYIRRPVVRVQETTGVLPPEVEEGMMLADMDMMAMAAGSAGGGEAKYGRASSRVMMAKQELQQDRARAAAAPSSMPVQTRERKLGDLFEYEIEHPVTIRRNQSALVPIVLRPFEGRPVLLYNKQTRADNPMRCVEFKNTTGLTLEGGPVTVLEGGSYVGEAMLETSKPDEQRLVPYAVELGIGVLDNVDSHQQAVHRVVIRKGILKTFYMLEQKTTYHFNNKSDTAQTAYLDHPRQGRDWKLADDVKPVEVTENYWRFQFPLPARQVTPFVVQQKQVMHQNFTLADSAAAHLELWMSQKYLDARTAQVLKQVIELQQESARIAREIDKLAKERDAIHADQKRIRENLQSLGDRSSEKELRERFVRTLNGQEDRLEQIEKELKERTAERDRCQQKINETLAALEYEGVV